MMRPSTSPTATTSAGERVIDAQYASSTLYVANTANDGGSTLFGVNFADGRIKGYGLRVGGTEKTFYVLCARGSLPYGQNSFVDNGDSTISDTATGLMWAQADSGSGITWQEALEWAQNQNDSNHLGYADWRLPSAKELQSIVDYTRSPETTSSPALNALFQASTITNEAGETDYPYYWTNTTHLNWSTNPGQNAAYLSFGRAMGYIDNSWVDVHGAGAQRSDPKTRKQPQLRLQIPHSPLPQHPHQSPHTPHTSSSSLLSRIPLPNDLYRLCHQCRSLVVISNDTPTTATTLVLAYSPSQWSKPTVVRIVARH